MSGGGGDNPDNELSSQEKVTAEWNGMAGEWDNLAGGYRDEFVKLLWKETGYESPASQSPLVVLDFGCATGLLVEVLQKAVAKVVAVDVAPSMVDVLEEKIKSKGWTNVEAHCAVVADLPNASLETRQAIEALRGKVDIVAASSVLSFVPDCDMDATMKVLVSLLKPGTGILCHSDWVQSDNHPNGFTEEKAKEIYENAGLQAKTTKLSSINMGTQEMPIFVGVAVKSS